MNKETTLEFLGKVLELGGFSDEQLLELLEMVNVAVSRILQARRAEDERRASLLNAGLCPDCRAAITWRPEPAFSIGGEKSEVTQCECGETFVRTSVAVGEVPQVGKSWRPLNRWGFPGARDGD